MDKIKQSVAVLKTFIYDYQRRIDLHDMRQGNLHLLDEWKEVIEALSLAVRVLDGLEDLGAVISDFTLWEMVDKEGRKKKVDLEEYFHKPLCDALSTAIIRHLTGEEKCDTNSRTKNG